MSSLDEKALLAKLVEALNNGTNIGTIEIFAGTTAPLGWVFCDGRALSRTDYSELFNIIGTAYGVGDGSTTFNIPNLNGRVPVGAGIESSVTYTVGGSGGNKDAIVPSHNHSVSAFNTGSMSANASHSHGVKVNGSTAKGGTSSSQAYSAGSFWTTSGTIDSITIDSKNTDHTHSVGAHDTNYTGNSATNANMMPYAVINYIIKVKNYVNVDPGSSILTITADDITASSGSGTPSNVQAELSGLNRGWKDISSSFSKTSYVKEFHAYTNGQLVAVQIVTKGAPDQSNVATCTDSKYRLHSSFSYFSLACFFMNGEDFGRGTNAVIAGNTIQVRCNTASTGSGGVQICGCYPISRVYNY